MSWIKSLDDKLPDGNNTLHEVIGPTCKGGRKPKPLKSSWHMNERQPPPDRKSEWRFYVDHRDGDTITWAKTLDLAMECVIEIGDPTLVIRPYEITEKTLRQDEEYNRTQRQLGR